MLMVNQQLRFADKWITGADNTIEHVQVSAAWQRRSRIESIVESTQLNQGSTAENHIAAASEHSGPTWIAARIRLLPAKPDAVEVVPEPTHLFESDLGSRF